MFTNYEYWQWDGRLFPGFYNSILLDSETINEWEDADRDRGDLKENQYYEIAPAYFEKIGKAATKLLFHYIKDDGIIQKMTFQKFNSPEYYNFETDRLVIDLSIDFEKLKKWAVENETELIKHVDDTLSDRPGFVSYVRCRDLETLFKEWPGVIIDFYLLSNFPKYENDDLSGYDYDLMEIVDDLLYDNLITCDYEDTEEN